MKYVIGVDLSGTKIETCLINERGNIMDSIRLLTDANKGRKQVLANIVSSIDVILKQNNKLKIEGIGIAIPGFCNSEGKIVLMPHVPLVGFNLRRYIAKRFGVPVFTDNNANCFALGEYIFGVGRKCKVVIGLIVGTGIGCGIIIDGRIFSGARGGAGECGHMIFDTSADRLHVGENDFEGVCSGPNMVKRFLDHGGDREPVHANKIFRLNSKKAKAVVEEEYRCLGMLIGNLVSMFNPDKIVIGGSVSKAIDKHRLEVAALKYSIPFSAGIVDLQKSVDEDIAGVIGAAALVIQWHRMKDAF